MMHVSLRKRGFTMVETLVVVALLLIMSGVLMEFFVSYHKIFNWFNGTYETASSAGITVSQISEVVRKSTSVVASHTIAGTTYTTSTTTLVVQVPSIDSSGNALSQSDYFVFYISDGKVYRRIDADAGSHRVDSQVLLSDTATSLVFTYDSSVMSAIRSVTVEIETSKTTSGRELDAMLKQKTYLRNK